MPDIPEHDDHSETDAVPELDDVVDETAAEPPAPPPNLDLFSGSETDIAALREALEARLNEELDAALDDLQGAFAQMLAVRVEARLRERIPQILDEILASGGKRPE